MAVRLGYSADTKLLIIHADDLGVCHSENQATIEAMETGTVNSASIMVPCPWFAEIAHYAKTKKGKDFGIHLTLTSEWKYYKWSPVTSLHLVPSLVNKNGYFFSTVDSLLMYAKGKEVEIELRNQIKKAINNGIDVTHLDAHMYASRSNKELLDIYVKLGREFKVPVLLTRQEPVLQTITLNSKDIVVDQLYQAMEEDYDINLSIYYRSVLKDLKPGLSCLLIHPAYDDNETKAVTLGYVYWGASWRQNDFDFFTSQECKELLEENNIKLITWGEIRNKILK
jgi:hypothetical protein